MTRNYISPHCTLKKRFFIKLNRRKECTAFNLRMINDKNISDNSCNWIAFISSFTFTEEWGPFQNLSLSLDCQNRTVSLVIRQFAGIHIATGIAFNRSTTCLIRSTSLLKEISVTCISTFAQKFPWNRSEEKRRTFRKLSSGQMTTSLSYC